MSTWTKFYIHYGNQAAVADKLAAITNDRLRFRAMDRAQRKKSPKRGFRLYSKIPGKNALVEILVTQFNQHLLHFIPSAIASRHTGR